MKIKLLLPILICLPFVFFYLSVKQDKGSVLSYFVVKDNVDKPLSSLNLFRKTKPEPTKGVNLPISISVQNYETYRDALLPYKPFILMGWASDAAINNLDSEISLLSSIKDPSISEKTLTFSSLSSFKAKLADPARVRNMKNANISIISYNTEGGLTPQSEMLSLGNLDPTKNSVVLFVKEAAKYGFKVNWAPVLNTAENIPDPAIKLMIDNGLSGVALQEQKFLEMSCVDEVQTQLTSIVNKYRAQAGIRNFSFVVQVMPGRCAAGDTYAKANCPEENISYDYQHCKIFVYNVRTLVSSLSIWALQPDDQNRLNSLIKVLRQ